MHWTERYDMIVGRLPADCSDGPFQVRSCRSPWNDLKIQYTQSKGKQYTEEEDQFIVSSTIRRFDSFSDQSLTTLQLCMTHKLGYGNWDELHDEIRAAWQFRFDWFIKVRRKCVLTGWLEHHLH